MDARLEAILAQQLGSGLSGLAGSDARVTLKLAEQFVNDAVAALLPPDGRVRAVAVAPRAGNAIGVTVTLAKPGFLPPLHATLEIDKQPALPGDPVLTLRISGGAGTLLKMAGSVVAGALPPWARLEQDRVLVDVHAVAAAYGQSALLRYARILRVTTEDRIVVVTVVAAV